MVRKNRRPKRDSGWLLKPRTRSVAARSTSSCGPKTAATPSAFPAARNASSSALWGKGSKSRLSTSPGTARQPRTLNPWRTAVAAQRRQRRGGTWDPGHAHRTRPHARPMPALFRPRPATATVARARGVRFGDAEEVDAEPCPAQPLHRVQHRDRPHKRRCRHLPEEDRERKARDSVRAPSCRQLQLSGNAGGARYIGGGSGGSMVAVAATRHGTSHDSLDSGLPSPESPGPGPVPLL